MNKKNKLKFNVGSCYEIESKGKFKVISMLVKKDEELCYFKDIKVIGDKNSYNLIEYWTYPKNGVSELMYTFKRVKCPKNKSC